MRCPAGGVLKKEGPLSLSSHLENRGSPVRRWLEERFPETRGVTREANRQLRGGEPTCPIPRVAEADASLVETALDYLLRGCLRVTSIERTVATNAVQILSRDPTIDMRAIEVEREAVTGIKRLRPIAVISLTRSGASSASIAWSWRASSSSFGSGRYRR